MAIIEEDIIEEEEEEQEIVIGEDDTATPDSIEIQHPSVPTERSPEEEKLYQESVESFTKEFKSSFDKPTKPTDEEYKEGITELGSVSPEELEEDATNEFSEARKHELQKKQLEGVKMLSQHLALGEDFTWALLGAGQMVENVLSNLNIIDKGSFGIPTAQKTRHALVQGFSQALSFYIPATKVLQGTAMLYRGGNWLAGKAMTTLFNTSEKLKRARDFTIGGIAGVGVDALAFRKEDPNAANLAFLFESVSQNPVVAHWFYTYLATKPEDYKDPTTGELDPDSPAIAVSKNITTGFTAGVISTGLLKYLLGTLGFAYNKIIPKVKSGATEAEVTKSLEHEAEQIGKAFEAETGVPFKTLEESVSKYVDEILPVLKATYDQADEAGKKSILEGLPQHLEPAVKEEIRKSLIDPIAKIGIGKALKEPNPGLVKLLTKYINGEKIDAPDYFFIGKNKHGKMVQKPIIESYNLLKFQTEPEIKSLLQALSRIIDTKSLKNKTYLSQIQSVADLLGRPVDEVIETLGQNVANLEKAVGYVDAYKALTLMSLDNVEAAFKKFKTVEIGSKDYERLLEDRNAAAAQLEMIISLGARESTLASHLLHAHTASVGKELTRTQLKVADEMFNASPEAEIRYTNQMEKIWEISKKRTADFEKEVKLDVDIPGMARRKVKVKRGSTKKGKRLNTKLTATKARIKRLEKKLANLKKGKLPKKTEPRLKTAEELKLEDLIEIEIEKLTIPKIQKDLQVKHARLTKKIKDLRAGKVTKKGFSELKTTEILELEAELKRVKQKLKIPKTNTEKTEANIKRLKAELDKLILTKKGTAKVSTKKTTTDLEKELIEEIKNQKERLGWLKDKHRVTLEDLKEVALQAATKAEAEIIEKSTMTQLRMRLLAPKLTAWAKYRSLSEEIFINGLLSSFKTPIVNGIGNNFSIGIYPIETFMAATRGGGPITHKEAAIFAHQSMNAIPTQLKVFWRAMIHGTDDVHIKTDIQKPQTRYLSKEFLMSSGWRGAGWDYIGHLFNLPATLVTSMDVAYKGLNRAGAVPSLAYRKAISEFMEKYKGRKPKTPDELIEVDLRQKEILENLDSHPDIKKGAEDLARKNTYTDDLPMVDQKYVNAKGVQTRQVPGKAELIRQAMDRDPSGIMRGYLPFYRTPYQLLRFGFERSPILRHFHRTLKKELDPKQSSPEVVQMAKGRVAASQLLFGGVTAMAFNGLITNGPPADPQLRLRRERAMGGPHWWTFNIGFGPIPFTRWDPIGLIFSQAAILSNFVTSMRTLNGYAELDEENNPTVEDRKLVEKYEELYAQSIAGLQHLIKDRHFLKSLMESVAIFDEDTHVKRRWLTQLRSRFDPTLSIFSSLRRSVIKGHHAGIPLKELPYRPESEWDADKQKYTGAIGGTAFERANRNLINESLNAFDEAQKRLIGYGELSGVQGPTITGLTVGEIYKTKNLMGETTFYPGTQYDDDSWNKPSEYVRNMMDKIDVPPEIKTFSRYARNMANSVFNIGATNIGTSESQSAVMRKLAEYGSKIEAPSQIKSFSVGKHSETGKSLGSVQLNTREQRFFIEEWIRLNTKGGTLEKKVRGWKFNSPPPGLDPTEIRDWWFAHVAKGGYSQTRQLDDIERFLRLNKDRAKENTLSRFKELRARKRYLRRLGHKATTSVPMTPTMGYEQYKSQMSPLVPLTEENKGQ